MTNTIQEIISAIYDTIMGNVGFSKYHVSFLEEYNTSLNEQSVDENKGIIEFTIGDKKYELKIRQV